MTFAARMKELMRKYGKVAIGVHLSVSCASITGLYVAIDNNVDVDAIFRRIGISPSGGVARRRGRRDPHPFRRRPRGGAAAQPDAGARGVQRRRARPRPHVQQGAASRQGPRHPRAHAARRQVPRALEARQDLSSCSLFWENDAYSPSRTACSECNAVNYSMLQFGAV
ncbi:hypothetical protein OsJ_30185 [Oryza sativa Japonica Group]|uniref:DUF1279 domain-containing protein n=1 Tax=Oryza sativa subsp. japonica TaxID=39947 RepID=B9G4U4_ORYSJ|nr:hypothetical protein OsJ_30185 [Oryza sativa Japonica Group]